MRSLVAASKYDSKMYTRMTLENILVVSQWVGLYGENSENPDDEYFEYISGKFGTSIILSLFFPPLNFSFRDSHRRLPKTLEIYFPGRLTAYGHDPLL